MTKGVDAFAVYDSREFLDQVSRSVAPHRREMMLRVDGMHCGACVRRIEESLRPLTSRVRADVPTGSCEIAWSDDQVRLSQILQAIETLGFRPQVLLDDPRFVSSRAEQRRSLIRIGLALLFGMQVMMLASAEYFGEVAPDYRPLLRYAQWVLATPVALYAGWPLLVSGLRALWQRAVTMDTPVAIAISAAYALSAWNTLQDQGHVYFDSVAMFVLLLSVARFFQQRGQHQAADRLRRLMDAQPVLASRVEADGIRQVPVSELRVDDRISVAPGAGVPADGLLARAAELDESLLTGEALPVQRQAGELAMAGSVNLSLKPLEMSVTRVGAQTVLSQIARLVQRAQLERPAFDTAVERVARHFVLMVLVLGAAALWFWRADPEQALQAALAVLVVTCPCALSLAVPTTMAAAITRLARQSILLVRTDLLLRMATLTDICLDKTGTLTTRKMTIAGVSTLAARNELECRQLAAALEAGIAHPIAQAFTGTPSPFKAEQVELRPGQGVFGRIAEQQFALEALNDRQVSAHSGDPFQRWFVLSCDGNPLAHFALREELRVGVRPMIQGLKAQGLVVHVLSGDTSPSVVEIGGYVEAADVQAGQTPESKLAYVRDLQRQKRRVMAVGDGINDGPLLAGADAAVGLASGAALAQAHGDAILMSDDLRGLSCLFAVGARARRIIKQNFAWALAYNLTMVPLAFLGLITPWMAALGMGGSSLLVTLNALRVLNTPDAYRCAPDDTTGSDR